MHDKIEQLIGQLTLEEKISLCTGKNSWQTQNIDRLGIPSITMSDGTNGVRFQKGSTSSQTKTFRELAEESFDSDEAIEKTYPATCFPTGSAIACCWDRELIGKVGAAIAKECKALGIDLLLGPGINTRRHPLTARNYEYYSEDPCLAGELASAMIKGVQGEGVGTSVKHYACHNSDSYRTRVNAQLEERALREIYLNCFERAIKSAKPLTVMSAYNKVNGVEASGDTPLVRDILKKEWGYEGAVICDWGAVKDSVEATKGGIDLQMPHCAGSSQRLLKAVEEGTLSLDMVDERVRRVLGLVLTLTEMKQQPQPIDFDLQHQLAINAAAESAVLLKNQDDILPLGRSAIKKLVVTGYIAKQPIYQGTGCAVVHAVKVDSPLDSIRACCADEVQVIYTEGYDQMNIATEASLREVTEAARDADIVLVFAGNSCPDESDDYNRRDIIIEEGHRALLEAVAEINANVVVVLASGEVIEMPWLDKAKGVLEMWYGGEGMGEAVARLLFGTANPCGKLSATMPVKLAHTPAHLDFADESFTINYSEGIYVGYRYYDKKQLEPQFPFGYGLSYTSFAYSNLRFSKTKVSTPDELADITVTVDITNTGNRVGKEVVQLYIGQQQLTCKRPIRELKGFQKILLEPQETKAVTFRLCRRDFAYYDEVAGKFVVDAADFVIELAASSRDIRMAEVVTVATADRPVAKLQPDCGFTELFADPSDMEAFDRLLEQHNIIKEGEDNDWLHHRMLNSFWSVGSYLDMNAGAAIDAATLEAFISDHNKARGIAE